MLQANDNPTRIEIHFTQFLFCFLFNQHGSTFISEWEWWNRTGKSIPGTGIAYWEHNWVNPKKVCHPWMHRYDYHNKNVVYHERKNQGQHQNYLGSDSTYTIDQTSSIIMHVLGSGSQVWLPVWVAMINMAAYFLYVKDAREITKGYIHLSSFNPCQLRSISILGVLSIMFVFHTQLKRCTVYWIVFTDVKFSLFSLSPFNSENFIFILHMNLSQENPEW